MVLISYLVINIIYRRYCRNGFERKLCLFGSCLTKEEFGVYKVEHMHLSYKKNKQYRTLCLRLVYYRDEQGRKYKFITNNWDITDQEVALIYKYRWTIELTFKKLKQNFQLHFFYSETENGIKTQIWCTLIAHLLLNVIRVLSESKKIIFYHCSIEQNTPNKSFGLKLGGK